MTLLLKTQLKTRLGLPWGSNEAMWRVLGNEDLRSALLEFLSAKKYRGTTGDASKCLGQLFTTKFRMCLHNSEYIIRLKTGNNSL